MAEQFLYRMLRNPSTGKPIKILTVGPTLSKKKKTLEWVSNPSIPSSGRYDTIGIWPTIQEYTDYTIVLKSPRIQGDELIRSLSSRIHSSEIVILSKRVVEQIGYDRYKKQGWNTILCLEELHTLYEHIEEWNGTEEHAIECIRKLLQYSRVWKSGEKEGPPPLVWITQYYEPTEIARRREIQTAIAAVCANPFVDRVVLLNEKEYDMSWLGNKEKIQIQIGEKRLTFRRVFDWIREKEDTNAIVAFANADTAPCSDSWKALWSLDMTNKCLALLRWDVQADGSVKLFGPKADSQDGWVVRAADIQSRPPSEFTGTQFPFGMAGCDNAIAMEMLRAKFTVVNPSLTLKLFHYHQTNYRTYNADNLVDKPMYLHIKPSEVCDSECIRIEKQHIVKGGFVTENGLVYTSSEYYTGKADGILDRMWSSVSISRLTPVRCKKIGCVIAAGEMKEGEWARYVAGVWEEFGKLYEDIPLFIPHGWNTAGKLLQNLYGMSILQGVKGDVCWFDTVTLFNVESTLQPFPLKEKKRLCVFAIEEEESTLDLADLCSRAWTIRWWKRDPSSFQTANYVVIEEEAMMDWCWLLPKGSTVIYSGETSIERPASLRSDLIFEYCGISCDSIAEKLLSP